MSFVKHVFNKDYLTQIAIEDIQKLIDNETEESLHLDYEEIPKNAKYDGLADHISGFLNTSGGLIVFGVSETRKEGRHIPHKITWSTIKKETLENNLYGKIDPWHEEIRILPLQNPSDRTQRIFIVSVQKSNNPPHMSNFRYYVRLNFQTQPIGHDQVLSIFKQYYLQKYDLVNTVYGPIYNELISNIDQTRIAEWKTTEYDRVMREKAFLLVQDFDLYEALEDFYKEVYEWNQALEESRFRLAKIINSKASSFFKKPLLAFHDRSALNIKITGESTIQIVNIDEAILNNKEPLDFWKAGHQFVKISKTEFQLEHTENTPRGNFGTLTIPKKQFTEFMKELKQEVKKDKLIRHVLEKHDYLQEGSNQLLEELDNKI